MRAHLIQATTNERDDAQLDRAANDAQFGATQTPQATAAPATTQVASAGSLSGNDDYWLGGYAGI